MDKLYDLIIIGGGPAGLAAAVYAGRARLDTLVIERAPIAGGQILNTSEVDNYPGLPGINGFELGVKFREHAERFDIQFADGDVTGVSFEGREKLVNTDKASYKAKAVLIATGAAHRHLGVPGEEELLGMGVSYCATCDGMFFRGRTTAVVGGGDVAVGDALFLARMCEKVYLIHRRKEFRAAKVLVDSLSRCQNVELIMETTVEAIEGEEQVEAVAVKNVNTGKTDKIAVDGVFVAVGMIPNTESFKESVSVDETGYIVAGEEGATDVPGVFVAGDVRTKQLRQVVTAVSDGANAIYSIERYLNNY